MGLSEWSLVFFTLLAQISAGIMAVLLFISRGLYLEAPSEAVYKKAGTIAAGLMTLALIFSFLHLGSPLQAVFALSNVATSWLSREIFMVSFFLGLLLAWRLALQWHWLRPGALGLIHVVAALSGLLLIYTMARVYIIPTVPLWNTSATVLRFFATAFLLGPLVVHALLVQKDEPLLLFKGKVSAHTLLLTITALVGVLRIFTSWYVVSPRQAGPSGFEVPQMAMIFTWLQPGLLLAALVLIGWWARLWQRLKRKNFRILTWAFILLLAAEIIGRYFFYALYYRIGL
ncbi:MAG: DmsC/YnfH family molybdoenzyme membrane anchor subunit [Bacteroidales bacterium]